MYSNLVSPQMNSLRNDDDNEGSSEATVKVERGIYNRLKLVVRKKDRDVKNTLNKMVKNFVTKEELFERYSPLLHVVTSKDSSIYIKDEKEGKLVEVILRFKDVKSNDSTIEIYCSECKSDYCVHTAFAMASNELGELNIKRKI